MSRPPRGSLDVEALYARHREPLLVWFARRTSEAESALDLWAETFACVVAGRHRFRGTTDDEQAGWLYGIARRQLALYHRRGKAEHRALARLGLEVPDPDPSFVAEIERRAELAVMRAELGAALEGLSDPVRAALELRLVHELPFREVAARLGASEEAVRARVSRGLTTLAEHLSPSMKPNEVSAP
jgi:RNA polymerase sigma-70 factor (ECF subfamily)